MIAWLRKVYRDKRLAREQAALRYLKARYHTFRAVLHCNEQALEGISAFDTALLRHAGASEGPQGLEELLSVIFELVDGLNRLSDNRYPALYTVYDRLAAEIRRLATALASGKDSDLLYIPLADARVEHARVIGGKAAYLGALMAAGAPVPTGFAMTVQACRHFLQEADLENAIRRELLPIEARAEAAQGGQADPHMQAEIQDVAKRIQAMIQDAALPVDLESALLSGWSELGQPPVSARSSALVEDNPEHSFAGQFSSLLNIRTPEALADAYKHVVASNFGPRPLAYRIQAGLPVIDFSMAVIVQTMVAAKAAGVLFTLNPSAPENGRMLLTAVAGLGTQAVGGNAPADVYEPMRGAPDDVLRQVREKTTREMAHAHGGLHMEDVPEAERLRPILEQNAITALMRWGRLGEVLFGGPQDMEWALDDAGRPHILQSRSIRLQGKSIRVAAKLRGKKLVSDGSCASPGRGVGRSVVIHDAAELSKPLPDGPVVLVLQQSLVDAASLMPRVEGVVVELGNPTDHLSCVAREYGAPMITSATGALNTIPEGVLVIVDADDHLVIEAPEEVGDIIDNIGDQKHTRQSPQAVVTGMAAALRDLIVPLNLTDAYGPTFSIKECRTLHDIVRFSHEKALISLFHAGDAVVETADSLVHWIEDVPLQFLVIDLGGGLQSGVKRKISLANILCEPLQALCGGMNAPGLRWRKPPPSLSTAGLFSRSLLDNAGERPVGNQNYALITRDYMNLNSRVDYHFAMIDSVCGMNPQENYIRFRFKGGGTAAVQRERRARFIATILNAYGFSTDHQGDLVTGFLAELPAAPLKEKLDMLGRLIGFSRLMDGAMTSDAAPQKLANAFLEGNLALEGDDFQE